jgi:hypothetical protein
MIEILLYGVACAVCGYVAARVQAVRHLSKMNKDNLYIRELLRSSVCRELQLQCEIEKLKGQKIENIRQWQPSDHRREKLFRENRKYY